MTVHRGRWNISDPSKQIPKIENQLVGVVDRIGGVYIRYIYKVSGSFGIALFAYIFY